MLFILKSGTNKHPDADSTVIKNYLRWRIVANEISGLYHSNDLWFNDSHACVLWFERANSQLYMGIFNFWV